MTSIIGYLISAVVGPIVGYFVGKYTTPELGAVVAGGVAGAGGRVLHLQAPPEKKLS